jgi:hypothetical protein
MIGSNKKITIALFSFFLLYFSSTLAQTNESFNVKLYNGTLQTFPLTDISKITFSNGNLFLFFNNTTSLSWNTSFIDYYYYQSSPTSVDEKQEKNLKVKISPNPATTDLLIIGNVIPNINKIKLRIVDNLGRLILQELLVVENGCFKKSMDVSMFNSGLYNFIFSSNKVQTVTQKVLINE